MSKHTTRSIKQQQKTRWENFLAQVKGDPTGANTRQSLFSIASGAVLQRSETALATAQQKLAADQAKLAALPASTTEEDKKDLIKAIRMGSKAVAKQQQLVANAQDMKRRGAAGSSYADDEYIRIILNHFGVPYTLVTDQVDRDVNNRVTETRHYVWEKEVDHPLFNHHNHALYCSGFDQSNATAVQAHWQSGIAKPEDLGFDLADQFIYVNEDIPFCQWRNTPRDGNCTIHAIYEVLQAASKEACHELGIVQSQAVSAPKPSKKALAKATPPAAPTTPPAKATPAATTTRSVSASTESSQITAFKATDADVMLAAKAYLNTFDEEKLQRLGKVVKAKYEGIDCVNFTGAESKADYVGGIAKLMQAMNHNTHLSDPGSLVRNEIDKVINSHRLSKTSIFAGLEKSPEAQVAPTLPA